MTVRGWLFLLTAPALIAGDDVPAWVRDAASLTVPAYGPKVTTAVLVNEESTVVADSARLTTTTRTAIKVLNQKAGPTIFFEQYDTSGGKVKDFRAWAILASGKVRKYGKEEIIDAACQANDVYNQCRKRMVSNRGDIEAGAVFAYEATVERQLFSSQLTFHFQDAAPVVSARFSVTLPAGWELKASAFNGAPETPEASGTTYSWRMDHLPALEAEPLSPAFLTIAPWVGVNVMGPQANPLLSWAQAARVLYELNEGQSEPDAAITAKAKALAESAPTEIEKIRAIGRFAQQINYVSVQVNTAKGGGYRPHAATQVFEKLYGDCKDKANLTRALLKAVGITAYPVAIFAGDRTHVAERWPSLGAFNHAISAIRVSAATQAPAVLTHPQLGRLLLFDSTEPYIPAGQIPDHEQGSLALIGAPEGGDLVRVPVAPAQALEHRRSVTAELGPEGSLKGNLTDVRTGEEQSSAIGSYRSTTKPEYVKRVERWVGRGLGAAAARNIEIADEAAQFSLKAEFDTAQYARRPQATMLVFSATPFPHSELSLTEKTRKYPVVLDSDVLDETVRIKLPEGFRVDELPDAWRTETPFGSYEASWKVDGRDLTFQRKIEIPAATIAPGQYGDLRKFLQTVASHASSPVVLVR